MKAKKRKFSEFVRRNYKKKQAPVKWKEYDDDFNNWIPIKDLINIKKIVHERQIYFF